MLLNGCPGSRPSRWASIRGLLGPGGRAGGHRQARRAAWDDRRGEGGPLDRPARLIQGDRQPATGLQAFLEANPDWRGRVGLLMVVVPSRTGVRATSGEVPIDELVGAVNGTFGSLEWNTVLYQSGRSRSRSWFPCTAPVT